MPAEAECAIRDSAELYRMKTRFQTLKEQCDERTERFRALNEEGNEILLVAERRAAALARRLTQLCALWSRVTHAVYERYKVLAEAWHESGELRAWLAQQAAWLDGLQRRLQRPQPAPDRPDRPDAEDISDQLYDLENYVQNHSDERLARIQDIGRQLERAHIMPDWIRAEVAAVTQRWHLLRDQAQERSRELEAAAREAAQCEVQLERLQHWAEGARGQLAAGGALRLRRELPDQRAALLQLERRAGPQRLHDQLQRLQEKLDEIEEELKAGGGEEQAEEEADAGEEAEAEAGAGEAEAEGGSARLPPAAPAPPDPDAVRVQLRRCLKSYRTLSEIKGEVEAIIKAGRKAVEERAVPEPHEFSGKIDGLKELYNRLGAQVTEAKSRLETALLTAREIQTDLQALGSWLDGLGAHPPAARQALELEMSRMQGLRDKLNANYAEFARCCDRAYLDTLAHQIDDVNARWERLREAGCGAEEVRRLVREAQAQLEAGCGGGGGEVERARL
ncbi:PREDICTED: dystrophin, isoforms A/C/F/G/H-like, partial [Papilio xuthus]|uniref:Dystrophin, isoforms A/C/F/G/H-like n=1 Tax=Papilio xuthus TaxID=66420 RepID=A0AAJ7EDM5_PAPXU